jgi:hypothetical protein
MSKSNKHKYKVEDDFDDDGYVVKPNGNRHKQKRIDRALKTKNIDELMNIDDEGLDPIDIEYDYGEEDAWETFLASGNK